MATAGSLILAIDYNNVQSKIDTILGAGSATRGYGQSVASKQATATVATVSASQLVAGKQYQIITVGTTNFTLVGAGSNTVGTLFIATGFTTGSGTARTTEPITALQLNTLKLDMLKIATHAGLQTNALITALPTVTTDDLIDADHYNAYSSAADYLDNNRFALAQYTDQAFSPSISQTRTTAWNAIVRHAFTIDFGSAANARYFFNSGSSIRIAASRSGGTVSSQNSSWSQLLSSMGTIVFNYNSCQGDTGLGTSIGFYQLTTTPKQVYQKTPSASVYSTSGNDYKITMSCDVSNNSNGGARFIYVTAYFNDNYPNNAYAYTDQVNGTLTHTVTMRRASGSNVNVAAPTAVNTILLSQ